MFDNKNRKIHNLFYLNIEFVGGQICCVVFAKSAQCQTCIWTNLKCKKSFTFWSWIFWKSIWDDAQVSEITQAQYID